MYIGLNGTVRVKIMKSIPKKVWVALGTATGTDGVVCCAVPTQRRRPQSSSAPQALGTPGLVTLCHLLEPSFLDCTQPHPGLEVVPDL